jgi:hypothetical protein
VAIVIVIGTAVAVAVTVAVVVAVAVAVGIVGAVVFIAVRGLGVRRTALAGRSLWWRRRPLLWRGDSRRQRDRVPVCVDMKRTWRVVVSQWVRALCLSVISFLRCGSFLTQRGRGSRGRWCLALGNKTFGCCGRGDHCPRDRRGGERGKEQRQSRAKRKGRERGRKEGRKGRERKKK